MDEMEKFMTFRKLVVVIFLLCVFIVVHASAGDLCYDNADPALSSLKTWNDLRLWYENYPGCDDGYFAEGLSDFVVVSLAKRWETLPSLQAEIMKNNGFKHFVLKYIDATMDENDLRMLVTNSKTKCLSNLRPLCKEIQKNVQKALKETKEIKK